MYFYTFSYKLAVMNTGSHVELCYALIVVSYSHSAMAAE